MSSYLWGPQSQYGEGQVTESHHLRSAGQDIHNPVPDRDVQPQVFKLQGEFDKNNDEQHSHIDILFASVCFIRAMTSFVDFLERYAGPWWRVKGSR